MKKTLCALLWLLVFPLAVPAQTDSLLHNAEQWPDVQGEHINAHGGCILYHSGIYYWYGENRPARGFTTETGVEVYTSTNLTDWTDRGVAFAVSEEAGSPTERGCVIERPKVLYNEGSGRFIMLFHLELKGRGYSAAQVGFAESDSPLGPFRFVHAQRPNPGIWPANFSAEEIRQAEALNPADYKEWWTPRWTEAMKQGLLLAGDRPGGQMSRDMTVFVDDDGKAYHIYASEENLTLHIAELTDDYLGYTGKYVRVAPGGHNEAPTILKRNGVYWMITSGCTGWRPNEARMFRAESIWGPWTQLPSPCVGPDAATTFHSQGAYIFRVHGQPERYVFMADRWRPRSLKYSGHLWLPVKFADDGRPVLELLEEWRPQPQERNGQNFRRQRQ